MRLLSGAASSPSIKRNNVPYYNVSIADEHGNALTSGLQIGVKQNSSGQLSNTLVTETLTGEKVLDNACITTLTFDYGICVSYEGITPLRQLLQFVWNHEVNGMGGASTGLSSAPGGVYDEDLTTVGTVLSDADGSSTIPGGAGISYGKILFTLVK